MNADSIIKVLDDLTQRLSGPAAEAWGVLMRQVQIEGIVALLAVVAGVAWLIYAVRVLPGLVRKTFAYGPDDSVSAAGSFVIVIASVVVILSITNGFGDAVGKVLNPAYYALMKISELIK